MDSLLDTQTYNPARLVQFHGAVAAGRSDWVVKQAARKRRSG